MRIAPSLAADGVVLAALLALTAATVAVAAVDLGPLNTIVAMVIAGGKALLVAMFFMHLRSARPLERIVAATGLLFMGVLIGLTVIEQLGRDAPAETFGPRADHGPAVADGAAARGRHEPDPAAGFPGPWNRRARQRRPMTEPLAKPPRSIEPVSVPSSWSASV